MDVSTLQSRLTQFGGSPGVIDGSLGPMTMTALCLYLAAPGAPRSRTAAIGAALAAHLKAADIWSPLRIQHFLAQAMHETGGLLYLEELGGLKYLSRYDGRADLGNTQPGDGPRYKGRGIFQLTGRTNYRRIGQRLDLPLEDTPQMAAEPIVSVRIAVDYWQSRNITPLADADDIVGVTKKINGGTNGLDDRRACLNKIRVVWGAAR